MLVDGLTGSGNAPPAYDVTGPGLDRPKRGPQSVHAQEDQRDAGHLSIWQRLLADAILDDSDEVLSNQGPARTVAVTPTIAANAADIQSP